MQLFNTEMIKLNYSPYSILGINEGVITLFFTQFFALFYKKPYFVLQASFYPINIDYFSVKNQQQSSW